MPLEKLKTLAEMYKQKYIHYMLKNDEEMQALCEKVELELQEKQTNLNEIQFNLEDTKDDRWLNVKSLDQAIIERSNSLGFSTKDIKDAFSAQ